MAITTTCSICNNTGWEAIINDGREFLRRCRCQNQNFFLSTLKRANIPLRFLDCELKSYLPQDGNPSQTKAKDVVREFINYFPAVKNEKGLLFQGPVGVGKTRLICSIGNELIKKFKDVDIYYIDWNDLVREMRSGESHETRDFPRINELISRLISVDLLIFDELGASRCSEWVQDNIYYVFNKRYNDRKLSICATNYPDKSFNNQETLSGRIGIRIRSRLLEMTETYEITGSDYRQMYG